MLGAMGQCLGNPLAAAHLPVLVGCLWACWRWLTRYLLMAACLLPSLFDGMVLGPLGTDHRSPSRQFSRLQEVGQGLSTATLGHSPAKTPVQPTKPRGSALSLPLRGSSHHRPHLTTTSLQKPSAHPRANGNLLFFVLSVFPQVAFPCKMPDMTPEGNLGVGGTPRGSPGT